MIDSHDRVSDDHLDRWAGLPEHVWVRRFDRDWVRSRLRLSLTEHCNLHCFFCHNEGQGPVRRHRSRTLSVEETATIARVAVLEGARRIKLTGGEPLLYRHEGEDVVSLVRSLADLRAIRDIDLSMTTNGVLLPEYADRLSAAGLDRVTVSLSTTEPDTFNSLISPNISLLARSMLGITSALRAGLRPLKLNTVLYYSPRRRLGNLHELPNIVRFATGHSVSELRLFTLLWHADFAEFGEFYHFFSTDMCDALESLLAELGTPRPAETVEVLAGLARSFADTAYPKVEFGVDVGSLRLGLEAMRFGREGATGQEGPYAIRIGADGSLRSTLNGRPDHALIQAIRNGAGEADLRGIYRQALEEMP
jgi:molybdenum cofactor biosynthesis enzyme MoaA